MMTVEQRRAHLSQILLTCFDLCYVGREEDPIIYTPEEIYIKANQWAIKVLESGTKEADLIRAIFVQCIKILDNEDE